MRKKQAGFAQVPSEPKQQKLNLVIFSLPAVKGVTTMDLRRAMVQSNLQSAKDNIRAAARELDQPTRPSDGKREAVMRFLAAAMDDLDRAQRTVNGPRLWHPSERN